jgi:hypothetical protein
MRITKQKSLVHGAQHPYVSSTSYQESKVEKYTNRLTYLLKCILKTTEHNHPRGKYMDTYTVDKEYEVNMPIACFIFSTQRMMFLCTTKYLVCYNPPKITLSLPSHKRRSQLSTKIQNFGLTLLQYTP